MGNKFLKKKKSNKYFKNEQVVTKLNIINFGSSHFYLVNTSDLRTPFFWGKFGACVRIADSITVAKFIQKFNLDIFPPIYTIFHNYKLQKRSSASKKGILSAELHYISTSDFKMIRKSKVNYPKHMVALIEILDVNKFIYLSEQEGIEWDI